MRNYSSTKKGSMHNMNMKEYYEMYLTLHQNKICRRLHVLGQIMTLLWVAGCLWYEYFWFLLLTPFIVYPFAWSGHYFFEKNQPAAFKDPVKAKISDWMMLWDILRESQNQSIFRSADNRQVAALLLCKCC